MLYPYLDAVVKMGNDLGAAVKKKTIPKTSASKPSQVEATTAKGSAAPTIIPPEAVFEETSLLKRKDTTGPRGEKAKKKPRMAVAATKKGATTEKMITRVELHEAGVPGALILHAGETVLPPDTEKSAEELEVELKELIPQALRVANDIVGHLQKRSQQMEAWEAERSKIAGDMTAGCPRKRGSNASKRDNPASQEIEALFSTGKRGKPMCICRNDCKKDQANKGLWKNSCRDERGGSKSRGPRGPREYKNTRT